MKAFSLISQFSFSVAIPMIIFPILANILVNKYRFPQWILAISVFLGIFIGVYNGFLIIKKVIKISENKQIKNNKNNNTIYNNENKE